MIEAMVIIIFVLAFLLIWYLLLYLIKHPNIHFHLEPKVLAHEPELEEHIEKVLVYLDNEEPVSPGDLGSLLGDQDLAFDVIDLLAYRGVLNVEQTDEGTLISRT